VAEPEVHLRPFGEPDLEHLARYSTDPSLSEPFLWFGFRSAEEYRRRWHDDRFLNSDPRLLIITESDNAAIGWVSWRQGRPDTQMGVLEIGALILPEHRGRGVGTAAQRMLVEYLFATTTAHRLWAGTESENTAEQKALERCGFVKEGLQREAVFRDGEWHDSVIYGLLRREA
jgi:RimJ/RimL family protein N-acetyltransferase